MAGRPWAIGAVLIALAFAALGVLLTWLGADGPVLSGPT